MSLHMCRRKERRRSDVERKGEDFISSNQHCGSSAEDADNVIDTEQEIQLECRGDQRMRYFLQDKGCQEDHEQESVLNPLQEAC